MTAMTLVQVAKLGAFALMLASGQMLFKLAATRTASGLNSVDGLRELLASPWFWLALVLYGAATYLWIAILQRVPLSIAYPFVALGFVIVPFGAWLLFGETVGWRYAGGVVLIMAGIYLTAS